MRLISQPLTAFKSWVNDRQRVNDALKKAVLIAVLFMILYIAGQFVPEGYDWKFLTAKELPPLWTPWTPAVVKFLNPASQFALTILAISIRSYKNKASPLAMGLAILSLPTIWVLYLGNLDGIVLLGILLLPWGVPLALMKPQLAGFSLLAKRSSIIAGIVWGTITLLIYGLWPLAKMGIVTSSQWKMAWDSDISMFPWGILIALPLLWFSRGDEDLLMAAGSFATPHLFPYHLIVLMPALGRMKWPWMIVSWLLSWAVLLSNWYGPLLWHAGNAACATIWLGIYLNKRRQSAAVLTVPKAEASPAV